MNCPSRPDDIESHPDWNQNPQSLNADATTRADLNGIVNQRAQRGHDGSISLDELQLEAICPSMLATEPSDSLHAKKGTEVAVSTNRSSQSTGPNRQNSFRSARVQTEATMPPWHRRAATRMTDVLIKYARFVGPGFLIAVAYIDPGNYATDVEAGASTRYAHLFVILMSNLFAIFLQSLCIKLGSVTGLDLAENCRRHLPSWMVWPLYILSEGAIIATDVAEVVGTAIALNLLLHIPLVAGCAISLVDVFLLLLFYNPDGTMTRLRIFEYFVMFLVLGVMICFCIQLSYIRDTSVGDVFRGYIPSSAVIEGNGVYLSCGILGATVMPHSIFLGSGIVQPRLRQFDQDQQNNSDTVAEATKAYEKSQDLSQKYKPSIGAIRSCLKYSIVELATSLFTFALFVNSAILIVAGSSLYDTEASDADLFGIHALLVRTISPAAGVLFALALLLSGTSAGIVCTMAGQMVSEGMIRWRLRPWVRRLLTRSISIVPSIVIAAAVGKEGLNRTLTASQVALSVALPFVSAPLLWFTCKSSIMTVRSDWAGRRVDDGDAGALGKVNMRNGWVVAVLGVLIWLVLVVMNVALIVLAAMGKA
ncbi:NRAMP-like transporter smf-3 [Exophiala xenobiotica]|uniref:NRAMP-like transporter smf-3 n=1 Tax=Lithohypha guttulata TaxID=1690604 RepID=A0ABR0K8J5_9EURO|nr:NRAMP-like transporter smf-3 [Lithohypha guttulata]KAK5316866.1 NRAMP-like transporter smf-3 [Exophiala xenobiotica]